MSAQLEQLRRFVAQRPAAVAAVGGSAVVVGSGKGGVGTTLVSALLALGAADAGAQVLLVDADVSMGSLHLLLGVDPGPGLGAMRDGAVAADTLTVPVLEGLTLLPGGPVGTSLSPVERQSLFRRLSSLYPRFDLVVIDAGARMDAVLGACGAGGGTALVVATPERIALTAAYALVKVMGERVPGLPVQLVVSRSDPAPAREAADEVRAASHRFLRRDLAYAGAVPEDACLRAALEAGMSLQDAAAGSPAAQRVAEIGSNILSQLAAGPLVPERRHLQRRS